MTIKELKKLPVGTLIYNGHSEGVIRDDCGVKVIEVLIPIDSMSNNSRHYDEKPEYWEPLED